MRAVLDAAGSERAAVLGISEGGAMAILFAAMHPERCSHLALWSAYARLVEAPDYPEGVDPAQLDRWNEIIAERWGGPVSIGAFAPGSKGDAETEDWWARLLRSGTSPRSAAALMDLYRELDTRHALPMISAPTLVMHRADDRVVPAPLGRYIAEHIPDSRYVEIPGSDHLLWWADADAIVDRSRSSSPAPGPAARRNASSQRSSSRTSSIRPGARPSWATAAGASCSTATTPSFGGRWTRIRGASSRPPETACSRPSTARPGRSPARGR